MPPAIPHSTYRLQLNKEFGFLKSDLWDNPDRIRREFFHRA